MTPKRKQPPGHPVKAEGLLSVGVVSSPSEVEIAQKAGIWFKRQVSLDAAPF